MNEESAEPLSPEEQELERKRAELAALGAELAEGELQLATLMAELAALECRYMQVVGCWYAELDGLEAHIAELLARQRPRDAGARSDAQAARERARQTAEALGDAEQEPDNKQFKPSAELKRLFREAAKRMHPDLTTSVVEKARRERLMKMVNEAYSRGDEEQLRALLREWHFSPESVEGGGPGAELVRVIRKIARVQRRLAAIDAELEDIRHSALYDLRRQVEEAATEGRDLLAEMATRVEGRIGEARERLAALPSRD